MTSMRIGSLRILLIAEEAAGLRTLRELSSTGLEIVAVVSASSDGSREPTPIAQLAAKLGLETWDPHGVGEPNLADRLRQRGVDLLLNVHSLHVIDPEALGAPTIGCFNLHPGPLPEYAGLDVVSWAIYRGETTHGVTVHWMDRGIDTGPIAYSDSFDVSDEDTALKVYSRCLEHGLPLIRQLVIAAADEPQTIPRIEQNLKMRRYYRRRIPQSGRLNWSRTAQEILNFVRACDFFPFTSPWGHPATELDGHVMQVIRASRTGECCDDPPGTIVRSAGESWVAASDEWIRVRKLLIDGKPTDPAAVLRSRSRLT